jgi:FlaA1/EpsC-like NDP-sugar epimerase
VRNHSTMIKRANSVAQFLLQQRSWAIGLFQGVLIFFCFLIAWLLRFDFALPYRRAFLVAAAILVPVRLLAIAAFRLTHGWWRYTGVSDALDVFKAVVTGSAVFVAVTDFFFGAGAVPRSVAIIEPALTGIALVGVRVVSRVIAETVREDDSARRLLLIGAGSSGQMLVRELNRSVDYRVVGFVDDDPSKRKLKIQGVPVIGTVDQLPEIVRAHDIQEVVIAVASAAGEQMSRFVQQCDRANVRYRTVPTLNDLLTGRPVTQLRDVRVEDLLGRQAVEVDLDAVRANLAGRSVLVTGAAGSIGSELCRQIVACKPATLVCVDQNETGMFYLERELGRKVHGIPINYVVADAGNADRMEGVMRRTNTSVIFHAAAYKHVPVMEMNVCEAVSNNIFGLLNLIHAAESTHCSSLVMISSDKAVNPASAMGATKRVGELILSTWPKNGLRCVSVRFGNVLGSSGSVVPVFCEQLQQNQSITITHPEVERFFMTITEAVSLVLQASVTGRHGDILVLDMGKPIRIVDLAKTVVRLSGRPQSEAKFVFTGLRPGEKLREELFYSHERPASTNCRKIQRASGMVVNIDDLQVSIRALRQAVARQDEKSARELLMKTAVEYSSPAVHQAVISNNGNAAGRAAATY